MRTARFVIRQSRWESQEPIMSSSDTYFGRMFNQDIYHPFTHYGKFVWILKEILDRYENS
jgi:hypothetical protein